MVFSDPSLAGASVNRRCSPAVWLAEFSSLPLTPLVARWRRWIEPRDFWPTAAGAALGFAAAALVAVNTLSTPVGPILSTLLIGLGAVLGSHVRDVRDDKTGH